MADFTDRAALSVELIITESASTWIVNPNTNPNHNSNPKPNPDPICEI